MITADDLQAAIAKYKGEINPDINTIKKLAACYICLQEIEPITYSYAPAPVEKAVYYSDTAFGQAIKSKDTTAVLELMDELMTTLMAIQPRLYDGVMRRLRDI